MKSQKKKVILTGYRAVGKTTVGHILANRLRVPFLDMDQEIEKRAARSIRDMVSQSGWDFFRTREKELLGELAGKGDMVIASGGGAIIHKTAWEELRRTGLVVWLTADYRTIGRRLVTDPVTGEQRPSLTGNSVETEVMEVLTKREPLYRAGSDLVIDTTDKTESAVAEEIFAFLTRTT